MEAKTADSSSLLIGEVCNHRKMLAAPALKILADPDSSEKSFKVLMSVMERCCKEPSNQGVFIGANNDELERKLGFGEKFLPKFVDIDLIPFVNTFYRFY
jgi:hypothetical protein